MSLNYQKDPAAQVPTLATGLDGVDSVVKFYQDGTNELKNILKNECSIIYECSYCRSLFRSVVNFVAHKRTICRSLQSSVRHELVNAAKTADSATEKTPSSRCRRNPASLRRLNLASLLGKHIQTHDVQLESTNETIELQTLPKISRPIALTTFQNGRQIVESLPPNFTVMNHVPEDRTVLVMPKDHSIRYREMQLRKRRGANDAKSVNCRELSQLDIEILQRIPPALLDLADLQELRCIHDNCVNTQPFASVAIISHHLAIVHQKSLLPLLTNSGSSSLGCFICGSHFDTEQALQNHFNDAHVSDRAAHVSQRFMLAKTENGTSRRGGGTQKKRSSSPEDEPRFRSISPPSDQSSRNSVGDSMTPAGEKTPVMSERALRLSERRRPHSSTASRRNSPRESSITPSKSDRNGNKRAKLVESSEISVPLINSEEARRLDELLNTASGAKVGALEKEDSEEEDEKSVIPPTVRGKRNKRPTKRFYNDDFVVDPTKAKPMSVEAKDKRSKTQTADVLQAVAELEDGTSRPAADVSPKPKAEPVKRRRRSKMGARKAKKQTKRPDSRVTNVSEPDSPENKTLLLEAPSQDDNDLENDTSCLVVDENLESRKEIIDRALRAESDTGESLISIRQSPMLITPIKATSEPPLRPSNDEPADVVVGQIRPRSDSVMDLTLTDDRTDSTVLESAKRADRTPPPQNNDSFVLPVTPSAVDLMSVKKQLPSILADKNRELMHFYTPIALKARMAENGRAHDASNSVGSSRRKQNLKEVEPTTPKNAAPPRPADLAEVPVYLTEAQRDMFFSPLRPLFNSTSINDGLHQCSECGEVLRCQRDGRRHMVGHLRVMRIRCMLCDVGAFFCGDMRIHLMFRHCEKLNMAPDGFVKPGDVVPCMDKQQADMLTQLVDPFHPGRVFFTSGKIISWTNPKAYYPDPRIEERILGKARPRRSTSLTPTPVKSKTIANSPLAQGPSQHNYDKQQSFTSHLHRAFNVTGPTNTFVQSFGVNGAPPRTSHPLSYSASGPSSSNTVASFHREACKFQPKILASPHKIVHVKAIAQTRDGDADYQPIIESRRIEPTSKPESSCLPNDCNDQEYGPSKPSAEDDDKESVQYSQESVSDELGISVHNSTNSKSE